MYLWCGTVAHNSSRGLDHYQRIMDSHAAMLFVLFVLPTVLGCFFKAQIISGLLILTVVPFFLWFFMYSGNVIACWF